MDPGSPIASSDASGVADAPTAASRSALNQKRYGSRASGSLGGEMSMDDSVTLNGVNGTKATNANHAKVMSSAKATSSVKATSSAKAASDAKATSDAKVASAINGSGGLKKRKAQNSSDKPNHAPSETHEDTRPAKQPRLSQVKNRVSTASGSMEVGMLWFAEHLSRAGNLVDSSDWNLVLQYWEKIENLLGNSSVSVSCSVWPDTLLILKYIHRLGSSSLSTAPALSVTGYSAHAA